MGVLNWCVHSPCADRERLLTRNVGGKLMYLAQFADWQPHAMMHLPLLVYWMSLVPVVQSRITWTIPYLHTMDSSDLTTLHVFTNRNGYIVLGVSA